ncbi:MAG: hypothetical protein CMJ06_02910 [Pelagibacterales bacterium]|nr:hypothetical protein [Pelagibacterales bacterium]MAI29258.1 hypothetical protein [Rickettsiales bacterium]OUU62855.1 MAG: hypothetical protein CBC22_02890 [Alphaproteobacteria bacterium TMED62]|tara:strand:- start:2952 stop:3734 length:783 start_codon:yes stop_codon:yes gene_type:complete
MIIDSHCHLNMKDFNGDLTNIISNAKRNSIGGMLTISTKIDEFKSISNIAKNNENIWYSLGIHPHNVDQSINDIENVVEKYSEDKKFIGIGETGLDYFYKNTNKNLQIQSFIKHIQLSRDTNLPIIVHTREADKDTIRILKNEYNKKPFKGLIHCFTATQELANEVLKLGFFISISGIITFKNAEPLRKVVKSIPKERLLIETDAPYLSPVPLRGKRNEPANVIHTANYLASLLNIPQNDLYEQTTRNFFNLFSKAEFIK